MSDRAFRRELVDAIPMLRAFARSLTGNRDSADDLVQETLVRAMAKRDSFQDGTNLEAWLVTILRNQFYSEGRKRRREVADPEGVHAGQLQSRPQQHGHMAVRDFLSALQRLPAEQREALVLIGISGFSYEQAAEVLGTRAGTVKSRVSRARARLEEMIETDEGPEPQQTARRADHGKRPDDVA